MLIGILPLVLGLIVAWKGLRRNWLGIDLGLLTVTLGSLALIYLILDRGGPPSVTRVEPAVLLVEGKRVRQDNAGDYQMEVRLEGQKRISWASRSHPGEKGVLELVRPEVNSTFLPMDWQLGEAKINGRGLWISPRALQQARMGGRPDWLTSARGASVLSWVGWAMANSPGELKLVKRTTFGVRVNGRWQRVPALKLRDSKSNSYWALDDDVNPLVLKMVPNRFTIGFLLVDGVFLWTPVNYLARNDSYRVTDIQSSGR